MSEDGSETKPREAVVLDYLPHGRADDDRPQYRKSPLAHVLSTTDFQLYELVLEQNENLSISDTVVIDPPDERISRVNDIKYGDLSGGARSELEHAVRTLVDADEDRFVQFYNEAGPVTLRLHQLNLLSGIGNKLRDTIIDERERSPFEDLTDLEDRISGLHKPKEIIVDRILEEIQDNNVKYKLFAREQ